MLEQFRFSNMTDESVFSEKWTSRAVECPRQIDIYSCGVCVMAVARSILLNRCLGEDGGPEFVRNLNGLRPHIRGSLACNRVLGIDDEKVSSNFYES